MVLELLVSFEVVRAACRLAFELLEEEDGRLRKARQALVLRQRGSGSVLMARRYNSSPMRRCSVSSGDEAELVNHDLAGSGAGGGIVAWVDSCACRVVKSEYRLARL